MPTNDTRNEDWIPLVDVLRQLRDSGETDKVVWTRILNRLKAGVFRGKVDCYIERRENHQELLIRDYIISSELWDKLVWHAPHDLVAGDVRAIGIDLEYGQPVEVELQSVQIASADVTPGKRPKAKGGGRPHGRFWPDVAEELALYAYEKPGAIHDDPVNSICEEILKRLATRGAKSPETIQPIRPVVSRIQARIRRIP